MFQSGNCGNLAAGVGVFAQVEGLVKAHQTVVNVWQVNTQQALRVHLDPCQETNVSIPGVPGVAPAIFVEFLKPSFDKK